MKDLEKIKEELKRISEEYTNKFNELIEEIKKDKKGNKRWRGEEGEGYFYVTSDADTDETVDFGEWIDDRRYQYHNYFQTQEEAQAVADNIKTHIELMELAEELDTEPVNWNNIDQEKYYLYFNTIFKKGIAQGGSYNYKHSCDVYCTNENFKEEAIKRIGEERLAKYLKGE